MATTLDLKIAERIREVFKQGPYTQEQLGKELGFTQGHINKLLKGDVRWRQDSLQKFCSIYQVNLLELLMGKSELPIVAEVGAEGFPYQNVETEVGGEYGMAPIPPINDYLLDRLYALKVKGDQFLPLLRDGVIVYAAKDSGGQIKDGDLCVFIDDEGQGHLRQVKIAQSHVILKHLNPSGEDMVRPISHTRLLDKVIWINLNA